MLQQLGIGVSALLLIFGGLAWVIARYNRAKKKQGAAEERQKANETLIEVQRDQLEAATARRDPAAVVDSLRKHDF